MSKIIVFFFFVLVFSSVYTNKESRDQSEEIKVDNTEINKSDQDASSIQVDVVTDKIDIPLINEDLQEDTEVVINKDLTKIEIKYESISEHIKSNSTDTVAENRNDSEEEVLISSDASVPVNNDYTNRQEEPIESAVEDITHPYDNDEKSQEGEKESAMTNEEDIWRSGEHDNSGKEYAHGERNSAEGNGGLSVDDYMDKKSDVSDQHKMEIRKPERRGPRPVNSRQYGHSDDHSIIDPAPVRSISEVIIPRYRPVLTRSGVVYTPSLLTMQSSSPFLDRFTGRSWMPNRAHFNQEPEVYPRQRQTRLTNAPLFEEPKSIDDYNDYGTNTYSYTPVRKTTTQAPPQQIMPPKFDVFQKLVEASNHPKAIKRTQEYPGNYQPRRQFSDSYGPYDFRRTRRNDEDELPLHLV